MYVQRTCYNLSECLSVCFTEWVNKSVNIFSVPDVPANCLCNRSSQLCAGGQHSVLRHPLESSGDGELLELFCLRTSQKLTVGSG